MFDREWRLSSEVVRANKRDVDEMIKQHYIGQWPQNIVLTMALKRKNKFLGVVTYSVPHKEILNRFGIDTWELSRLWIEDSVPKNAETFLIGRSIRFIKKNHTVKKLISFADPKMGHSGIIYKASNWTEDNHESKHLFFYNLG